MSYVPPPATAIELVRQAKARYCRYLDTKKWDAFAELFIADPEISIYGTSGELLIGFSSRESFTSAARGYLTGAQSIHQVHNDELTQRSEGEIGAIWSMEDHILFPKADDGRPSRHHGYGHYHETWVHTADGWRIASLELHRTILEITP